MHEIPKTPARNAMKDMKENQIEPTARHTQNFLPEKHR
jgi:hypothetical protein